MANQGGSDPMMKLENTEKRDTLIAIERKYQQKWQGSKVFEADAPEMPGASQEEIHTKHPKSFVNFAYPYMNGTLHVGHSFTISKPEFSAGFSRLQGKRVLFPLGYHCTGMPIKACADKLVKEVEMFGQNFERYKEEEADSAADYVPAPTQAQTKEDITKFTATKGKANAKTIKAKYQFQIMLSQGIPKEELHKFSDPQYWLQYFPPLCKSDLIKFGARIDWRRQFVTTNANPYYDAFVRWQMNRLHEQDKIQYGSRYTIYSPKDGQPCMDHDRDEGEAILPQEYTALKLKVKEWSPKAAELVKGKLPADAEVYFVPATLRPETMYGQVCCFVGPNITYGVYEDQINKEYYVFTKRAAWNLAFQGHFFDKDNLQRDGSVLQPLVEFSGSAVVGTLVSAPLSIHKQGVRILPMDTVLATKGTGVVTSVPSDSPDDYATIRELAKKPEYYGIQKEWAELEIVPIIKIDSDEPHGNIIAKYLVEEKYKIQSPKDKDALAKAKDDAYKDGYYKGSMIMGDFKGESVESAKPKVREALMKSGDAFAYAEPAGRVTSRSGDECVVAYLGQWFLDYGDGNPEWKDSVSKHLNGPDFNSYTKETENAFEGVLGWLNRWACARSFGLGTKLPWDKKFLVESLSDSTVYMSYYTIAHFLHGDMFGKTKGIFNISPEQMTDDVWDYIMTRTELSDKVMKSGIAKEELETMRRQLEYWYPFDMRTSGKDLIPNHLTFCLYIHAALFPQKLWPRSIRVNGHLQLNGAKMSKSKGNFLTINDACSKFGADATRIALADAGDGVDDANFDENVANSNILRLYTLKEWCEEVVKDQTLRTGAANNFFDKLFENEMNLIIHEAYKHYEATDYKLALKSALYDFTSARDFYREATSTSGIGMHKDLVLRYIEQQALLLSPIAPHWSDYIWSEVVGKPDTIQNALWPKVPEAVTALTAAREYVRNTSSAILSAEAAQLKKKSKGKAIAFDPKQPKKLTIFAANAFPAWQDQYIELVRKEFEKTGLKDDKELLAQVKKMGDTKKAMPFVQGLKRSLQNGDKPQSVFDRSLPFNELQVLEEMVVGLKKTTGCKEIDVVLAKDGGKSGESVVGAGERGSKVGPLPQPAEGAVPGVPTFHLENITA